MQLCSHTGVSSGRSLIHKPRLRQSYANEPVSSSVFSLHKDTQAHAARRVGSPLGQTRASSNTHNRHIPVQVVFEWVCQEILKKTLSLNRGITDWTVRWELQLYLKRVNAEHLYSARSQWYPDHQTPDRTIIQMDTFFVEVGGKLEHFTGTVSLFFFVMVLPLKGCCWACFKFWSQLTCYRFTVAKGV